jgi:dTDP-4-dehydrorhamnose reductase
MKILLLGEKGYLGSFLYENIHPDILSTREIYNNGIYYDYIINCIGTPNLEYCESNEQETNYSNRDILIDIQKFYPKSKIINFSSYYVYNGEGLNTETSPVTYAYNYTRQKLEGEKLINNGVSFRVGKLFGHSQIDKQNKLTEYIIKNQDISLDNIKFNPTSLSQVLKVINFELKNNVLNGIYNLSNEGVVTHYEYGVFIDEILNSKKNISQINKISRIFDNYGKFSMDCSKIQKYINLDSWKSNLIQYLNTL